MKTSAFKRPLFMWATVNSAYLSLLFWAYTGSQVASGILSISVVLLAITALMLAIPGTLTRTVWKRSPLQLRWYETMDNIYDVVFIVLLFNAGFPVLTILYAIHFGAKLVFVRRNIQQDKLDERYV